MNHMIMRMVRSRSKMVGCIPPSGTTGRESQTTPSWSPPERSSRGEAWEHAAGGRRWALLQTALELSPATGVGEATASARGSHPPLCDLGWELVLSDLESLSHRVDVVTSLPLSPWLAGRNVIVVTSRRPPG